ncbi:DUF5801 repeats-in-toxin domain-containing protein, partial [uncultured Bilophila sp.]|uniref:DUF5801 repeats-in-toxin domain-containing protein n=1 Tax=uncultured Bilophila sp. TaxID=529385 RepID=UPI0026DBB523
HDASLTDEIAISVTDQTGDTVEGSLIITIVDDVPSAQADTFSLSELDAQGGATDGGNVLANDVFGADAPADKTVTSIEGGTLGEPVKGTHGELTLNADGTYSYRLNPGVDVPQGETYTDRFTYTITDADGDTSTATITVNVTGDGSVPTITVPGADSGEATVYESDLPGGSNESGSRESTSGEITLTLNGESATVTIGGATFAVDASGNAALPEGGTSVDTGEGTLTITAISGGTVSYTYTLKEAQTHDQPTHDASLTDEIAISVTDQTGDTVEGSLVITIVDDVPTISINQDAGHTLAVDESFLDGQAGPGLELAGSADHAADTLDASALFTVEAGADGEAERAYSLVVENTNPGVQALIAGKVYDVTLVKGDDGVVHGMANGRSVFTVSIDADSGQVALVQEPGASLYHPELQGGTAVDHDETLTLDGIKVSLTVTDNDGDTATKSADLKLSFEDDGPSLDVSDPVKVTEPGIEGDLFDIDPIGFTDYSNREAGKDLGSTLQYAEGAIKLSAGLVTYGDDGNISVIKTEGMTFGNSAHTKENDRGLTVNGGAHNAEIGATPHGNTGEAVIIDLDGLAYGVNITFGAFYSGSSDPTVDDHISERALVSFYKNGNLVYSTEVTGNSKDGAFTLDMKDFVTEGFDRVIISAVDNGENSDFTLQSVDFVTSEPAIVTYEGTVAGNSGADGFASGYENATFNYTDGESIRVSVNGDRTEDATLHMEAGRYGGGILTATTADGTLLFTAILGADGKWTFRQHEAFQVETDGTLGDFQLEFITKDGDGDIAIGSAHIDLRDVDLSGVTGTVTSSDADVASNTDGAPHTNVPHAVDISLSDGMALKPGATYTGEYGKIVVDANGKAFYEQTKVYSHAPDSDMKLGAETIPVEVTLGNGTTVTVDVTVNIQDDMPDLSGVELQEATDTETAIHGNLTDLSFGADSDGATVTVTIDHHTSNGMGDSVSTTEIHGTVSVDAEGNPQITWDNPDFTLNADGSFSYARPGQDTSDGNADEYTFTVQVADGDGDRTQAETETVTTTVETKTLVGTSDADNLHGGEHNDVMIGDVNGMHLVEGQSYNLAFIVDTSGSMSGQMAGAKDSLNEVVRQLWESAVKEGSGTVNVLLVGFATGITENVSVDLSAPNALRTLQEAISGLKATGGTNYELGLKTAANWFASLGDGGTNQTFFITDGQPTYYQKDFTGTLIDYRKGAEVSANQMDWSDYVPGKAFYAEIDGQSRLVVDAGGTIYKWTEEKNGWTQSPVKSSVRLTPDGKGGYECTFRDGEGNRTDQDTDKNSKGAFDDLKTLCDTVTAIGIGGNVSGLGDYSTVPPMQNINGSELADAILGKTEDYVPASDVISGGAGADILFGDLVNFVGDTDSLEALRTFVATLAHQDPHALTNGELADLVRHYHAEIADALDSTGARGGDDVIHGGAGDDLLFGQGGNDTLSGGEGNDILYGGTGNDLLVGDGDNAPTGAHFLNDLAAYLHAADAKPETIMEAIGQMDNDDLRSLAQTMERYESATDGDDWLFGGEGHDVLFGMGGNDRLFGGAGDDVIFGGSGDDYLDGGTGADKLLGGSGNDIIRYDASDLLVDGGSGTDFLVGDNAMDALLTPAEGKPEVTNIEVFLDTKMDLTSMDDLADRLGIALNEHNQITGLTEDNGWSMVTAPGHDVPDGYVELAHYSDPGSHDAADATILVQKAVMENGGHM